MNNLIKMTNNFFIHNNFTSHVNFSKYLHTMTVRFTIPPDMTSVTQGQIAEIFVEEGQKVIKNQLIMKIETDKVVLDETSPVGGLISKILVEKDQNVNKNTNIYRIDME